MATSDSLALAETSTSLTVPTALDVMPKLDWPSIWYTFAQVKPPSVIVWDACKQFLTPPAAPIFAVCVTPANPLAPVNALSQQ
jgi:hypothetical protein